VRDSLQEIVVMETRTHFAAAAGTVQFFRFGEVNDR